MEQSFNRDFNSNNTDGYGAHASGFFGLTLKKMITFFVILEAVTAIILFGIYIYFFDAIANNIGANQADGKAIAAFLLAIVSYLLWKTFFAAYTTLNFIKNADYHEISANRYLFIALSLSLGGLWTPFILTALPNTNVQSTINPRYFLTKTYGIITAFGSLMALGIYFLALKVGVNGLDNSLIFQSQTLIKTLTVVGLSLTLTFSIFGFLSILVWNQGKKNDFNVQESNLLFKFVSSIWLAIVSFEVLLTLVYAIVRFLGILSNTFRYIGQARQSGAAAIGLLLMFPILMINIMFQLLYVAWIGYIVQQTIKGLWQPQVTYRSFESLSRYQEKREKLVS